MDYSASTIAWIALLPFCAFVINAFIVKKFEKTAVTISCLAIFGSFLISLGVFTDFMGVYSKNFLIFKSFTWFDISSSFETFEIPMGIYIDNMTAMMLLMVSGAATLIHLFSTYYMNGDSGGFGRFFVYMSLFTSAMLGLVLSSNLLSVFVFWEIMGFCSYSLIGYYNKVEDAGNASIKAFMTTRVGDVFFLLGILCLWSAIGNVNFVDIYAAVADGTIMNATGAFGIPMATFAGFCIFMGTIGKSAQFPLQVWLPDAMMGPTPCSALIHAATMVAAGVYLSLRIYPLLEMGGLTTFVAYVGAITAFGAATVALIQTDIKAVLAYSTISQLGYMVMGIGVGSYNAAFMHLITHAVFKACLFLSAGSVIHGLHEKEMPRMGGLRHKLPYTFIAMLCCSLAIAGVPLFSGFVSKDRILGDALYWGFMGNSPITHGLVPLLGFAAALLTAFYMFRMIFLTFFGEPRDKDLYDHAKQEKLSWNRNIPLLIFTVFTLGVWYSGSLTGQKLIKVPLVKKEWFKTLIVKPEVSTFSEIESQPFVWKGDTGVNRELAKSQYTGRYSEDDEVDHAIHSAHSIGAIISVIIALSGIFLAFLMYGKRSLNPSTFVNSFSGWYRALQNKYYFDHLYIDLIIKKGLLGFNKALAFFDMGIYDRFAIDGWKNITHRAFKISKWFDNIVIDLGILDFFIGNFLVKGGSLALRLVQSGKIQFYFIVLIFVLCGYILSI